MTEIVQFSMNHWGLVLIFVFALVWVITMEMQARLARGVAISTEELTRKMNDEDAKIFDVRTESHFSAGHILSAAHIAESDMNAEHKRLKSLKTSPFILVCEYGTKSAKLANQLRKAGFEQAYSLAGGLEAWKKADLPLVSD
jgi:rhodanese-related sulfurtransferase